MIAWFARNGVAANLIMAILMLGGLLSLPRLEMELFPEFSLDQVVVRMPYPGATPQEVEEGIVVRIEEAVQGVEGIKKVSSTSAEGYGQVFFELENGYKLTEVKENIKTRVDSITTFPENAERPTVEELTFARDVLFVAITGPEDERTLRLLAERVRDDLTQLPGISQVGFFGVRDFEVAIEVTEETLRAYSLTFDEVVNAVRRSSLDLPAGSIKADGGEILLRTLGQAYDREDFAKIVLRVNPDGTRITLADIATVNDGFTDVDRFARFDGKPAVFVQVQEMGTESPLDISAKVQQYIAEAPQHFPEGIQLVKFADSSFYLKDRLNLLVKNGLLGLVLVLAVLTAFLRPMLAMFVALGIPVSFLGTIFLAPWIGLSINMVSLFAFILVLGIVVDDAIVVGESVFSEYQRNGPGVNSAIRGTKLVSTPVTFAVLTTVVAFLPLFFLPGFYGKLFMPIPLVVITTLLWSLVESKLVLPYHLSLLKGIGTGRSDSDLGKFQRLQRGVANSLERFVNRFYQPVLEWCLNFRYLTLVIFGVLFFIVIGLVGGGWVRQVPFPPVPSDYIQANLEFPAGTSLEQVERGVAQLERGLREVVDRERAARANPVDHEAIFTMGETHSVLVLLELTKSEERDLSAVEFTHEWREATGTIPGAKSLSFVAEAAARNEKPIDIQLEGRDFERLQEAARLIKLRLAEFPAVFDLGDNFTSGKREIRLRVKPEAELLGVTPSELGRQVRAAFYGAEAQRIQRGRNEIRVMVRYPREERESVGNLEAMRIRLPNGVEVPFGEVAEVELGQGFSTIQRVDRERVINITGDIDTANADVRAVTAQVNEAVKEVLADFPEVRSSLEGQTAENRETMVTLFSGFLLVLIGIYALLAVPFKSYFQPMIVMTAIPFAYVGAVLGHFFTGQPLSQLSYMGIIAAVGVVVNDSLVLVDYVNQRRREGHSPEDSAHIAGHDRFRPIFLTSLTTFVGLAPILLERSLQAKFLIPMATSLAFGVVFATFVTLLLVPALYLILHDAHLLWKWIVREVFGLAERG
jgi:multidrug efflux pump subunit AcrB